jgi:hypothetical protein
MVRDVTVAHADAELRRYSGRPILDQLDMRLAAVERELGAGTYDGVVGRGGLLRPLPGGTYLVDDAMLEDLAAAHRGEHASNLGPFLASRLAGSSGCDAYTVDPVSVDEWTPVARYSGVKGLDRESLSHALNTRAVARRHATETATSYDTLRLVVLHLGSGITVSAHRGGRMVDACNSMDEGPFAMDRAGGVPVSGCSMRPLQPPPRRTGRRFAAASSARAASTPTWARVTCVTCWPASMPATRQRRRWWRRCSTRCRRRPAPWPRCWRGMSMPSSSPAAWRTPRGSALRCGTHWAGSPRCTSTRARTSCGARGRRPAGAAGGGGRPALRRRRQKAVMDFCRITRHSLPRRNASRFGSTVFAGTDSAIAVRHASSGMSR